jgi:tetratricopeptide (TPR) repeat protein
MSSTPPSAQQWREAMQHFESWMANEEPQRSDALQRLAIENSDLYSLVQELIAADRDATNLGFLGEGGLAAVPRATPPAQSDSLLAGSNVGPWRLERVIGTGGMGEVWLAHRDDGFYEGDAAVKLLRAALSGAATDERFAREGKILARLVHPHIAHLLDAGIRPDGRRYLVLEYVAGERIDEYCDSRHLNLVSRVRLFLQVCAAIGHAHVNLVVHRDIKPSNILVDASGAVKLLDFGIAKLLEDQSENINYSPLTELMGAALTPEYAAPEQIEGGSITTATDVYALGVVLCRLLSGFGPYTGARSPAQLARTIVDRDPRKLSVLPEALDDELQRLAANRDTSPERLVRELRGDLEHIVTQALRKTPAERYPSVLALADDLQRYLEHAPVAARGDHFGYRMRRFVRRHRLAVALGVLAIVTTFGGLGASLWQAQRAQQQAVAADRSAARAQAITHFLLGIFEANSTEQHDNATAQQTPARELLDIGRQRIATELRDQPDVRAEVSKVLAEMYWQIGRTDVAADIDAERIALLRANGAARSLAMVDALNDQSSTLEELGHSEDAIRVAREALTMLNTLGVGNSEPRAQSLLQLGVPLSHSDAAAAVGFLEKGYAMLIQVNPDSASIASAGSYLAAAYKSLGRTVDARRTLEGALAQVSRSHGPQNSLTAILRGELSALLQASNHFAKARDAYADFYQLNLKVLGSAHAETVTSRAYYAQLLGASGQRDTALAHLQSINAMLGPAPGSLAPQYWGRAHLVRAKLLVDIGDLANAVAEINTLEPVLNKSIPKTGMYARFLLVTAQQRALSGDAAAALVLARRSQRLLAELALPCHVGGWAADAAVASYLQQLGRFEEAVPELKALDQCASAEVDETPFKLAASLAHARDALGRNNPGDSLKFSKAVLLRIGTSEDHDFYILEAAEAHRLAGSACLAMSQAGEAKAQLNAALAILTPYEVDSSPRLAQLHALLAAMH